MNVAQFDFPRTLVKMFKFVILFAVLTAACVIAQDAENYEVCVDLDDETQVGVGHDISCTKYYFCSGGVGALEDCTEIYGDPDLAFNEESGQCEYDVVCGDGGGVDPNYPEYPDPDPETDPPPPVVVTTQPPAVVTQTTTTSRPGVIEDVTCPTNRPNEIIFFPSSNCSQYFICASGVRLQMSCIDGFVWNEDDNQCDYPIFSRCASREVSLLIKKLFREDKSKFLSERHHRRRLNSEMQQKRPIRHRIPQRLHEIRVLP